MYFCGSFILASDVCPYSSPEEAEADFLARIEKTDWRHAFWHGPVDGQEKLSYLNENHFFCFQRILYTKDNRFQLSKHLHLD